MSDSLNGSSKRKLPEDLFVVNLVGTVDLGYELDLAELAMDLPSTEYNPERYPSMVFRASNGVTLLVPRTGRITLVGAKRDSELDYALDEFCSKLSNLSLETELTFDDIEIQNIVVQGEIGRDLDLSTLAIWLGLDETEYEPEQFPGLVYKLDGCVALIFGSGKFVITGANSTDCVIEAYERLQEELGEFEIYV